MRALWIVSCILLLPLAARADDERAEDPLAPYRSARTTILRLMRPLADEASAQGDWVAAQAIAETYLWVAGVPHPNEDRVREEITRPEVHRVDKRAWLLASWKALAAHVAVLAESPRDWDVLDARLVAQLPDVLPGVREVNAARIHAGLVPMRYDAKRCGPDIAAARKTVADRDNSERVRAGHAHYPVTPDIATRFFLDRVATRLLAFDPQDKGLTVGTWPREVHPPDPRMHVEPMWRHRLAATSIAPSGNRATGRAGPKALVVWPPPSKPYHRWATGMSDSDLYGAQTPVPVSLHGFGAMPAEGATIEVTHKGQPVEGLVTRLGRDGNWALTFAFRSTVAASARYEFVARSKDGVLLKRWTMTTNEG